MGLTVAAVATVPALEAYGFARISIQIATGVIIYSLLVALFHRTGLRTIYLSLTASPSEIGTTDTS